MSYGLTLPSVWGADYQEHYLPSPYIARPVQPDTRNPNILGPWLVLHRLTHIVACKHETEQAARMCARGERCVKQRGKVHHKEGSTQR